MKKIQLISVGIQDNDFSRLISAKIVGVSATIETATIEVENLDSALSTAVAASFGAVIFFSSEDVKDKTVAVFDPRSHRTQKVSIESLFSRITSVLTP